MLPWTPPHNAALSLQTPHLNSSKPASLGDSMPGMKAAGLALTMLKPANSAPLEPGDCYVSSRLWCIEDFVQREPWMFDRDLLYEYH